MVLVAPVGRFGAVREHAMDVDQGVLLPQPVRDLVGLHMDVLVEVDHRLHGHLRVGVATPQADLFGADR